MADKPPFPTAIHWYYTLLLVLVLGFALRLWMAQPPNTSDELAYFHLAHTNFLSQEGLAQSNGRLAMLAWIRTFSLGWGDHWLGFYLATYAAGLLSSIAVAFLARVVLGWPGAVLVSLLWATSFGAISNETRLYPDVLGSGLAIFAVAMAIRVANLAVDLPPVNHLRRDALLAGLLLWMAVLVRETFFTHAVLAMSILWWGNERRTTLPALLLGLGCGLLLELIITGLASGDPFMRYEFLLSYPKLASEAPIFQGHTWGSFLTRYPRVVWYTGSAEIVVMLFGMLGAVRWLFTSHLPASRIGLAGLVLTFGTIALVVVQVTPPVPLMRESMRYYYTAMPFIYLAAFIFLWILYWNINNRHGQNVAIWVTALPFFLVVAINLHTARNSPGLIRNGNNLPFMLADNLRRQKLADGVTQLYMDDNLRRGLVLLLPPSQGWNYRDLKQPFTDKGLLLLDYSRLHYKIRNYNYHYNNFTPEFYRMVERYPIVWRFQSPLQEMTEMYQVGGEKIRRTGGELPLTHWSPANQATHLLEPSQTLTGTGDATAFSQTLATGLPQGLIFQFRFRMKSLEKIGGVQGALTVKNGETTHTHPLGQAWSDGQEREMALWTHLDQPLAAFQVTLTPLQGAVAVDKPQLFLLQTVAADRLTQPGDPVD